MAKDRFVSCLKEKKLVSKGCIYRLVSVNDSSVEIPLIQSVPVVSESQDVFSYETKINFGIGIILDTQLTSIVCHIE